MIRRCSTDEMEAVLQIINDAASAYRGVIPADCWREPYMSREEIEREVAAGVTFYGYEEDGRLEGVMGIQDVGDVTLIRHAYVRTARRRGGIGGRLLAFLLVLVCRPVLVGTWAAAVWAIRFYEARGFSLVPSGMKDGLLRTYWTIPDRQIDTSVVLADRRWFDEAVMAAGPTSRTPS